ncbi:uncharacterized protein KZ484_011805 [Pholidichthys leucotaenia]
MANQQLWNQERTSVLEQQEQEPPQMEEQQEPEPPWVKEEEEERFISQEGEQPVVKLEADTFMVTPVSEKNEQSEAEPNSEQVLSHNSAATEIQGEEGRWHVDSESIKEEEEPKPKKRRLKTRSHSDSDDNSLTSKTLYENETDFPQQPDCKEEVLVDQQLWNQERISNSEQQEQEPPQVKEEEEELFISQEGKQPVVKVEADMVTLISKENEQSEAEPNSEQVLSHNSSVTEIQDEEGHWHVDSESIEEEEPKPKKRRLKTRSHSSSDDNSLTSKTLCENETGLKDNSGSASRDPGSDKEAAGEPRSFTRKQAQPFGSVVDWSPFAGL